MPRCSTYGQVMDFYQFTVDISYTRDASDKQHNAMFPPELSCNINRQQLCVTMCCFAGVAQCLEGMLALPDSSSPGGRGPTSYCSLVKHGRYTG